MALTAVAYRLFRLNSLHSLAHVPHVRISTLQNLMQNTKNHNCSFLSLIFNPFRLNRIGYREARQHQKSLS